MIKGIGIDAVQITRMEKWAGNQFLLERFFDQREIEIIKERGKGMIRTLASHFAAKEAFAKALGTGLAGIALRDIMILNHGDERPTLYLEGTALKAMKAAGAKKSHVSLTHDGGMALAFVVLEV